MIKFTTEKENRRQSNLELLRIVSMLLIVAHHFSVHWGGNAETVSGFNQGVLRAFITGGKIGVNIFVLIGGYFLINSKFSLKRILKLYAPILFYSLTVYLLFVATGKEIFDWKSFLYALFPVGANQYWFMSCYIFTLLLAPFVNLALKNCDAKGHIALIAALLVIQTLVTPIFGNDFISNTGWFVTLYIIAAYIRLHPCKLFDSNKIAVPIAAVTFSAVVLLNAIANINLYGMTNLVCVVCSAATFCSFKNFRIPYCKPINLIASATAGVYLIHDNIYMRKYIWPDMVKVPFHAQFDYFIAYAFLCVLAVFTACAVIDGLRQALFWGARSLLEAARRKTAKPTDGADAGTAE